MHCASDCPFYEACEHAIELVFEADCGGGYCMAPELVVIFAPEDGRSSPDTRLERRQYSIVCDICYQLCRKMRYRRSMMRRVGRHGGRQERIVPCEDRPFVFIIMSTDGTRDKSCCKRRTCGISQGNFTPCRIRLSQQDHIVLILSPQGKNYIFHSLDALSRRICE